MNIRRYICIIAVLGISGLMMAQKTNKVVSHTFEVDGKLPAINEEMEMETGEEAYWYWASKKVVTASWDKDCSMFLPQQSIFFNCMVEAFANHYSVTLSPDIIWTVISQQFSHYINLDPEKYRDKLVNHEGKMELSVETKYDLYSPKVEWDKILSDFDAQIAQNTKGNIADVMRADFSTTGTTERIASQVMLMSTVKAFFSFVIFYHCGIPSITIEGTPDDWRKIIKKTEGFRSFDLDWWVDDLTPILQEFVKAAEGNANNDFWRNIVKKDRPKGMKDSGCGGFEKDATELDGWFLKFIPFSNSGRTPQKVIIDSDDMLPNVASAPFIYKAIDKTGKVMSETPMNLIAGLVGIDVDQKNRFMRPRVGWMVCESNEKSFEERILDITRLRVNKIPEELKSIEYLPEIELYFMDEIDIPKWMSTMKIDKLSLHTDKISKISVETLKEIFPDRDIHVEDKFGVTYTITAKQSLAPEDYVFIHPDRYADFPGSYEDYKKYMEDCRNKASNPKQLPQMDMEVEFIVEKDGSISNITVQENPDASPEHYEEAKRIISGMPKWKPAYREFPKDEKVKVRSKKTESITVF